MGGLQSHLIPYTAFAGKLVLMYRWDADQAIDLKEREGVTAFSGVPATAFALLARAKERGTSLPSLTGLASGATLVPPELVRQVDDQFAARVAPGNGYGLTETSGAMVANVGADYVLRPDSVGRPLSPVNEMRLVDRDGVDVVTGTVGEVWFRGPTVVRGYYNNAAATAASFTDGWFHTGDLGYVDPTASSTSSTASRTSSSGVARTCTPPRSRPPCSSTLTSSTPPSSGSPTPPSARRSPLSSSSDGAAGSTPTACGATWRIASPPSKCLPLSTCAPTNCPATRRARC